MRFHGIPIALMRAQAKALGIPCLLRPTTSEDFEQVFLQALGELRADGVDILVFGDIYLADVRSWYEDRMRAAGMRHVEPL